MGFTEDDCMMISDTLTQLPIIFFPKIKPRTKEQLTPFNHQLFAYCVRKKINPFDHFFDEMGLCLSGVALFGGIYKEYNENYGKKIEKKDPLNSEHENKIRTDEMNRKEGKE